MTSILVLFLIFTTDAKNLQKFPYPSLPQSNVEDDINHNLLKTYELERTQDFRKKNQEILKKLSQVELGQSIDIQQATKITNLLINHPIAGDSSLKKYSGKTRTLGFCFGRATLAHLELLRRGVDPKSIRKIFILGEMLYEGDIWELHVATIVKKTNGGWWVLDGLFNATLEINDWYKKMLAIAINKKNPKLRLYIADPVKFLPISGAYNEKDMYRIEYNNFFQDLSTWLESHPIKSEDKFFAPDPKS